jgi:hypothetical protein
MARDITGVGGGPKKGGKAGAPGGGSEEMQLAKEHLAALTTQVKSAAAAMSELTASARALKLRADLEGQNIDFKKGSPEELERMERALHDVRVHDRASLRSLMSFATPRGRRQRVKCSESTTTA